MDKEDSRFDVDRIGQNLQKLNVVLRILSVLMNSGFAIFLFYLSAFGGYSEAESMILLALGVMIFLQFPFNDG